MKYIIIIDKISFFNKTAVENYYKSLITPICNRKCNFCEISNKIKKVEKDY
jgi:lipoate synthase